MAKDKSALKAERLERLMKAVRHEKPDRTPITVNGNVTLLKYFDSRAVVADIVRDPVGSAKKIIDGLEATGKLENFDMISGLGMWPGTLGSYWFCKDKLPGRELPEDALWQLDEKAFMTRDDYEVILNKGWDWYTNDVTFNRLGFKPEDFAKGMRYGMEIAKMADEAGQPDWTSGEMFGSPIDKLTSGRGTVGFFKDMRQIPDKLHAVIDCIMESELAKVDAQLKAKTSPGTMSAGEGASTPFLSMNPNPGKVGMCLPAIRCTCDYISEKLFEEFIWPTMYPAADKFIAAGLYVFFHNDSNWSSFLHFYTRFPKKTCVYDSDGQTDIYLIKKILGDSMCLTGNVSPSLLTLGTPDEVYKFCRKQIEDMGDAYILSGACSLPPNAKPENLDAMNAAVEG
jgi:uroporphyrinogen decarboxylase